MSSKPDIIFIITDQQRYDTIAALGASHMETPNIDRLADRGVVFEQCHVTAPSCVPCRASLYRILPTYKWRFGQWTTLELHLGFRLSKCWVSLCKYWKNAYNTLRCQSRFS